MGKIPDAAICTRSKNKFISFSTEWKQNCDFDAYHGVFGTPDIVV